MKGQAADVKAARRLEALSQRAAPELPPFDGAEPPTTLGELVIVTLAAIVAIAVAVFGDILFS